MEKDIEKYLVREVEKLHGLCWKFTSPGNAGVPDRLVLLKGRMFFVELKREKGGRISNIQKYRANQLMKLGYEVYFIKSKQEVRELLNEV